MKKVLFIPVVFVVVLILGGFANTVFGQSSFDLPDPGLTPESPIYFLDLWDEQARLFFARSDSSRVKRYRAHVLERLSEAETLAGRGISATQRALELYRAELPFFYAAAERLDDVSTLETALRMASDHLDVLDRVSERTDFEKKRFVPATKIFLIEQQLQTLHVLAKRDSAKALQVFGEALQRRMTRIRDVAIDDQNNQEALEEYAAYMSETDRILRDWDTSEFDGLSVAVFLGQAILGHEETLLGPVREHVAPTLESELLLAVNSVRKLLGKEHFLSLPPVSEDTPSPPPF